MNNLKLDEALEDSTYVLSEIRKILSHDWRDFTKYDWPNDLRKAVSGQVAQNTKTLKEFREGGFR